MKKGQDERAYGFKSLEQALLVAGERDLDVELGEDDPADGDGLSADARQLEGAVDEDAVVVDEVHDGAQLAGVGAVVDEADTADFQVFVEGLEEKRGKLI